MPIVSHLETRTRRTGEEPIDEQPRLTEEVMRRGNSRDTTEHPKHRLPRLRHLHLLHHHLHLKGSKARFVSELSTTMSTSLEQ